MLGEVVALLASILIINPGTEWMAAVQTIPAIQSYDVRIDNIDLRPPVQRADEVRPITIYQVVEIYTP